MPQIPPSSLSLKLTRNCFFLVNEISSLKRWAGAGCWASLLWPLGDLGSTWEPESMVLLQVGGQSGLHWRTCLQDKRKQNRTEAEATTALLRVSPLVSSNLNYKWRHMRTCGWGDFIGQCVTWQAGAPSRERTEALWGKRRRVLLWSVATLRLPWYSTLMRAHTALIQHWP